MGGEACVPVWGGVVLCRIAWHRLLDACMGEGVMCLAMAGKACPTAWNAPHERWQLAAAAADRAQQGGDVSQSVLACMYAQMHTQQ